MDEPILTHDQPTSISELGRKRETLSRRLEDGYLRIDSAANEGRDVADWESFWIGLLREYEQICDSLSDAGDEAIAA